MLNADLKVLSGRHQGKVISLTTRKFLVGRGEDCHLRPNNDLVSRHHCVFNLDDYSVRLRDLGSTNGTHVNNERIQGQVEIKTGDQIRIGKLELEVTVRDGVPVQAAVAESNESPETSEVVPVDDHGYGEFSQQPGTETIHDTGMIAEADTTFIPSGPAPPMQYGQGAYPPGYGYPPQGYPPQGMPPGYGYPYPPMQQPGYPQYQMMPPGGYPQYPGMPYPQQMPQMGYPPQQQAPPVQEEEPVSPAKAQKEAQFILPDPEETGVKEAPKKEGGGGGANKSREENPSQMAGDIIQQYMRRRPNT